MAVHVDDVMNRFLDHIVRNVEAVEIMHGLARQVGDKAGAVVAARPGKQFDLDVKPEVR